MALSLLGVGMTSIGATTIAAARLLRGSLADREVAHYAWAVADSVLAAPDPRPGQRPIEGGLLAWTVVDLTGGTQITLVYTRAMDRRRLVRRFEAFGMEPPPALPPP